MRRSVVRALVIASTVLPLAACGGARTNPLLPATWEIAEKPRRCSIEFAKDGKVHLSGDTQLLKDFQFAKPIAEFNLRPGANTPITYRQFGKQELQIEGDYTVLLEKLGAGGKDVAPGKLKELQQDFHPREMVTYAVTETELTLTSAKGKTIKLKRLE